MARSELFDALAEVAGDVAEALEETIPVSVRSIVPDSEDAATGEPDYAPAFTRPAVISGAAAIDIGADRTEPRSRYRVKFFDPTILVREGDLLSWGDGRDHIVTEVLGKLRDGDGRRYGAVVGTT